MTGRAGSFWVAKTENIKSSKTKARGTGLLFFAFDVILLFTL
jgi:hypothetical protein